MQKLMLAAVAAIAVAMAFAVMPALIQQQASAVAPEKLVVECKNKADKTPEGQQPECKNPDSRGLEQECTARNRGQAQQTDLDCVTLVP